jgi:peroxiredoxin
MAMPSCPTQENEAARVANGHILQPGTTAPDFTPHATPDQSLSLSDLKGRPVVLAFYPADWSPVCGDQMALYNEALPEFQHYSAEIVGISVDGVWCHAAFAKDRNLQFPLLADFEPKGAVAKLYGAYRNHDGYCERALFVIDRNGVIAWSYLSPVAVNPGADGILQALEQLSP